MEKKKILILAGVFLALLVVVLILEKPYKTKEIKEDEHLVAIDSKKVDKITIKDKNKETVLVRKGDKWVVENEDSFPADQSAVADILKKLDNMKTTQMVSKNPEKTDIFQVNAASGIEVKAEGKGVNAHFYIGKNGSDFNSNYVRREGSDAVYLSTESLTRFFTRPDFRTRNIFDIQKREITRLNYKFPDREIELVLDADTNWKQIKNEPYNADKDVVVSIILGLKGLRVDEFVKKPDEKKFENPQLELSFNCEDGYENTLVVAKKGEGDNHIFVKSASERYQYKVSERQINKLTDKLKDLKEKLPPPTDEKPNSRKIPASPSEKPQVKPQGKTTNP